MAHLWSCPECRFLTLINSAPSDSVKQKVVVSMLHSVWWSFLVTFVGALALCLMLGTPALFIDLYSNFELKTYVLLMCVVALAVMLVANFIIHSKRELSSISQVDSDRVRKRRR